MKRRLVFLTAICSASLSSQPTLAASSMPFQERGTDRFQRMSRQAEERGLADPFVGITTDGSAIDGLFPIRSTGVSTAPVRVAANEFLSTLDAAQRESAKYDVDDPECIGLMRSFIAAKPKLWNEDIGK